MASPTFTINGIPCSGYIDDELVESYGEEGPTASMTIQCLWANRREVIKGLLGTVTLNGTVMKRNLPAVYPLDDASSSPRVCIDVPEVRGVKPRVDAATGWITYEFARIKASFGIVTWNYQPGSPTAQGDPSGIDYVVTKIKTSSEVFSPPGGSFYYASGPNSGKPVEESTVGVVRPRVELVMTRMMLPLLPITTILGLAGGVVNNSPFVLGSYQFPTGFLLFLTASNEPRIEKATGQLLQDVEMSFIGNSDYDWNYFMDRSGAFNIINSKPDGTGHPPFSYANFFALFSDNLT